MSFAVSFSRHSVDLRVRCYDTGAQDLARLIRAQLFGVGTIDLPSLSIAIVVLVATAVVASYLPARRAAKVGPLEALRLE